MDEQQKNRKKTLKALLIFGGVLLLALIAAVVYFYAIGDLTDDEDIQPNIACGCYMIDPAVINDCGDPKKAFLFNINKVASNQVCNAQCDTNQLSENLLNSTTPKESYKSCTVKSISDTRCENMILKDENNKTITGKITEGEKINVEATFDLSTYTNYIFKVNSNTVEPDKIEGNKISKQITDPGDADSIEILATATDSQGDSINSIICRRVVAVTRSGSSNVNSLVATTAAESNGSTKLAQLNISAGQLASEDIKVKFSFSNSTPSITATDGLTVSTSKGSISMSKVDLYNEANFEGKKTFAVLDSYVGDVTISAEVFVGGTSIGSASTKVTFAKPSQVEEEEEEEEQPTKSKFVASKEVAPLCVERVEGSNTAKFTIKVKNGGTKADTIVSIKDKLPLGFSYKTGSTTINGNGVEDNGLVTVTPVGDSQEIVWQPSTAWSVAQGAELIITFDSTAGTNAITGQNQNEIVVNPTEIPENPATLRAEAIITVAQDCDNAPVEVPSTGIFDSIIGRILVGILILLTAWAVYTRPEGTQLSKMIVGSGAYQDAEMIKYKLTNPKKYFEEKTLRSNSKENRE